MTTQSQPAKRFRLGTVRLTIWSNTDRSGRSFYTTTVGRAVRDANGNWSDDAPIRTADLPTVRTLTASAIGWMQANPIPEHTRPCAGSAATAAPDESLLRLLDQLELAMVR